MEVRTPTNPSKRPTRRRLAAVAVFGLVMVLSVAIAPAVLGVTEVGGTGNAKAAPSHFSPDVTPTLTLSPSGGPVGSTVTANGTGFDPNLKEGVVVTITFNGGSVATSLSPCLITPYTRGTFSCSFTVPAAPNGDEPVVATETFLGESQTAAFNVFASLTLLPTSGLTGTLVTATGTGFDSFDHNYPGAQIVIYFNNYSNAGGLATSPSPCLVGTTGNFSCTFTVPAGYSGPVQVIAVDDTEEGSLYPDANATFTDLTPGLTLSITSGPVGSTVTASGSGFAASSGIVISFNGAFVTTTPSPCSTDGEGNIISPCTFLVPAAPFGAEPVIATDGSGHSSNAVSFGVTTSLTLSPTSGPVKKAVTATGTGFAATSAITITFNGKTVATTCTSNPTGSFRCTFKVPAAPHGPQTVVAKDASGNSASATFSVKAKLTLSPTSGPGETVVTVTGTGFAASSAIKITFNGTKVATCRSNAVGSISCTFDVPVGKNSSDTVKAKDASGNTASTTFTRN